MRFKNLKTGNIIRTEDKATIAQLEKSDRYEKVYDKKKGKAADNKQEPTD